VSCRFKLVLIVPFLFCAGLILGCLRSKTVTDPLSGVWTGDWGPTPSHRNSVTVDLKWDGATLRGAINPGPHATQFTKASFDSRKGAMHLELEIVSAGREFHYVIDGTIDGHTLIGTWYNEDNKGNFRLIRK
jgi:hypothetical protein